MAGLAYEINAAGDDDPGWIETEGDLDGFFHGAGGGGWDSGGLGGGEEIGYFGGTRGVDGREDYVVEDGEEDLGHLAEGFVAEAGEDHDLAGTGIPHLRGEMWGTRFCARFLRLRRAECGAEGPGAGGIVGYVENELGTIG